jgi:hypothetical protein
MRYRIRVFSWNPNGTNDIEIINSKGQVIDCLPEALFGFDVGLNTSGCFITPKKASMYVAISPVEDGSTTLNFLRKYFK